MKFRHWCFAAAALTSCTNADSKTPGIDLGAPEIRWADKNEEQRFGFMAARLHPVMHDLFAKHDKAYAETFSCETCHGREPELVDYRMPSPDVVALPRQNTIGASLKQNADVANFMMAEVQPQLQNLLNQGQGAPLKTTCFSCHPAK